MVALVLNLWFNLSQPEHPGREQTMNITTASVLIAAALADGRIDIETAKRANIAIREPSYYGNRMTNEHRARIIRLRFGIEG